MNDRRWRLQERICPEATPNSRLNQGGRSATTDHSRNARRGGRWRKREAEDCPTCWVRHRSEVPPPMGLHDLPTDGKSDSHAIGLGGRERLEQSVSDFVGNARTCVGHPYLDRASTIRERRNRDYPLW